VKKKTTDFYEIINTYARDQYGITNLRKLVKNYREGQGLNLTRFGLRCMKDLGFEHESFTPKDKIIFTGNFRILLDKYMQYPYYVDNRLLVLFGSEDRIMFKLYGKDMTAWMSHMETNL
jgi:hypothetical protein